MVDYSTEVVVRPTLLAIGVPIAAIQSVTKHNWDPTAMRWMPTAAVSVSVFLIRWHSHFAPLIPSFLHPIITRHSTSRTFPISTRRSSTHHLTSRHSPAPTATFRLLALTCNNQLFPSISPTCESSLPVLDAPRSIFPWTDAVAPWG